MADEATRKAVSQIPLLKTNAGPRDRALWPQRLKEEYQALIRFVEQNKTADNDWFRLESNPDGTRWTGTCWFIHELLRYEFRVEFDIPVTYPDTAPEVAVPELDGKTAKMYRGGKICLTEHFAPLWARNVPRFGLAHLMALGLGPWLAVEIPDLISKGIVVHKDRARAAATEWRQRQRQTLEILSLGLQTGKKTFRSVSIEGITKIMPEQNNPVTIRHE